MKAIDINFNEVWASSFEGMADHDLWQLCTLQESKAAFKFIFQKYYSSLFLYGNRISSNETVSTDAVQDLFADMWTSRNKLGAIQSLKAYLFTSLRRRILNQMKLYRRKQVLAFEFLTRYPDIIFSQEMIHIDEVNNELRKSIIKTALNELSKRQREIIYLKFFESLSYDEIAQITGVRYQSILNHVQLAMRKLRENEVLFRSLKNS